MSFCSDEIKSAPKDSFTRNKHSTTTPFQAKLESHPVSIFPTTFTLQSIKTRIHWLLFFSTNLNIAYESVHDILRRLREAIRQKKIGFVGIK